MEAAEGTRITRRTQRLKGSFLLGSKSKEVASKNELHGSLWVEKAFTYAECVILARYTAGAMGAGKSHVVRWLLGPQLRATQLSVNKFWSMENYCTADNHAEIIKLSKPTGEL